MGRLRKGDVERMMGGYDLDPIGALTVALRRVMDAPDASWEDLLRTAGFTCDRRIRLHTADPAALDELLRDLNELRTLP
jgi:hypothetical protein